MDRLSELAGERMSELGVAVAENAKMKSDLSVVGEELANLRFDLLTARSNLGQRMDALAKAKERIASLESQLVAAQERLAYVPNEEDIEAAAHRLCAEYSADEEMNEDNFDRRRDMAAKRCFTKAAALDALTWERFLELAP